MDMEIIAPMVVTALLILTVGGVILLKPIANKLGHLLEAMAKEREEPRLGDELIRIRELLETMNNRMDLLEDRQDFTESLLQDPDRKRKRLSGRPSAEEE